MKIFLTCNDNSSLASNNESLIQFGLGKRNTAAYLLTKTLTSNPIQPEMLYNLAIFHLFTGNYKGKEFKMTEIGFKLLFIN